MCIRDRGVAYNHRLNLSEGILIKDNHIQSAGSVTNALKAVKEVNPLMLLELEVDNLDQIREALLIGVDGFLLDNMPPAFVRQAANQIKGRAIIEVSGGITIDNVREFAAAGADYISIGALTHSAPAVNISLEI